MKETTIKLSRSFKKWLGNQGKKSEDYEDIILRLIAESQIKGRVEENE